VTFFFKNKDDSIFILGNSPDLGLVVVVLVGKCGDRQGAGKEQALTRSILVTLLAGRGAV
jgi:hypothetical protein